jgi:hypothetical protein
MIYLYKDKELSKFLIVHRISISDTNVNFYLEHFEGLYIVKFTLL